MINSRNLIYTNILDLTQKSDNHNIGVVIYGHPATI